MIYIYNRSGYKQAPAGADKKSVMLTIELQNRGKAVSDQSAILELSAEETAGKFVFAYNDKRSFVRPMTWEETVSAGMVSATEIKQHENKDIESKLVLTDGQMARVTEDLIDLLIEKGIILKKDLPKKAIDKMDARKSLREKIKP